MRLCVFGTYRVPKSLSYKLSEDILVGPQLQKELFEGSDLVLRGRIELGSDRGVRWDGYGWITEMGNVLLNESPHKDRSIKVCVCVCVRISCRHAEWQVSLVPSHILYNKLTFLNSS